MDKNSFYINDFDKSAFKKGLDELINLQKEMPSLLIFNDKDVFVKKYKNTPENLRNTFYFCKNVPNEIKEKIIKEQQLFLNFKIVFSNSELRDKIIMSLKKVNFDFTEEIKSFAYIPEPPKIKFNTIFWKE